MARNADIRLRRSSVSGNVPTIEQLNLGELAINTADGKLFLKRIYEGIEQVIEVGGDARSGLVSTFNTYIYTSDGTLQTLNGADDYGNFLSYDLSSPRRIQVYLNGVLLHQGIDYTAADGESIVFAYPIDLDQVVQVAAYNSDGASIDADLILDDGFSFTVGTDEETKLYHNGSNTILKHMAYGDNTFNMMWRDSDRLIMGESGIDIVGHLTINGNDIVTDSDVLVLINDTVTNQFVSDLDLTAGVISYDNDSNGLLATNVQAAIDELQERKLDVSSITSNVTFFPTTNASDLLNYGKLVTSIDDSDFNTTAVAVNTGLIDSDATFIAQVASDKGVLEGSTGSINIHTIGNIRRHVEDGSGLARFYFEVCKIDSDNVETIIGTSSLTSIVGDDGDTFEEFYADALIQTTTFGSGDRVGLKFYGRSESSNTTSFDFQFGGAQPVRTSFPVPLSVIPQDAKYASEILTETTNFGGLLSGDDNTVQKALDTLDNLTTDELTEGTSNLFFTGERVFASLVEGDGIWLDSAHNKISVDLNVIPTKLDVDSDLADVYTTIDSGDAATLVSANSYTDSALNIAITNIVDGAPGVLDTLNELANAIGDDSSFYSTVQNWVDQKLDNTATTTDIPEGSNLYFTEDRAKQSVSAGNGLIYNAVTGEFSMDSSYDAVFNSVSATTFTGNLTGNADTATYSDDADRLDGEHGSYYRINVYDLNGNLLN